jgi:hypothetical protein
MTKTQRVFLDEVVGYFDELEDPRAAINQKHPLVSVVVIAMLAELAGAGGPTAIAKWANLKAEFLLELLELPKGDSRQGCVSACVVVAQTGRLSKVLCELAASVAPAGCRSDWCGQARLGGGWQDVATQP